MRTSIDLQNGGVATVAIDTPTEYGEFTKSVILAHPLYIHIAIMTPSLAKMVYQHRILNI